MDEEKSNLNMLSRHSPVVLSRLFKLKHKPLSILEDDLQIIKGAWEVRAGKNVLLVGVRMCVFMGSVSSWNPWLSG